MIPGQTPRSVAIERTKAESRHTVYIVREGEEIVYIGRTVNLARRMKQHASTADWYSETLAVETEVYEDYNEASRREAALIWNYRPRGNRQNNPDYHGNCFTFEVDCDPVREAKAESLRTLRAAPTAPVIFVGLDLAYAAMTLLWAAQREHGDRPEVVR